MIYHILLILSVIISYEIFSILNFKSDLKKVLLIYKRIYINLKKDSSDNFKEKIILLLSKHLFFKSLKILAIILSISLIFLIFYFFEKKIIKIFYNYLEIFKLITFFFFYHLFKKKIFIK